MKEDGLFYLRNVGRRVLTVNCKVIENRQRAILGTNCLIEVRLGGGWGWCLYEGRGASVLPGRAQAARRKGRGG